MRSLSKNSATPHDVSVGVRSTPIPGPEQVRVRTEACGLCGSDVHAWRNDLGYEWVEPPVTLGHEAVGRVDAVGQGADPSWIGKRVVPVAIDGCGACVLCAAGKRQICEQRAVLGLSFNGAAADTFVVAQERLVAVDGSLPASTMALTEPLSVACRAVGHVDRNIDDGRARVVVSGPGPIGIMCALVLATRGHDVILMGAERDEAMRLPLARDLGLRTVVGGRTDLPFTPNAWIEASGAVPALDNAIEAVLPGSPISVVGLFADAGAIDLNAVARKEIALLGSYGSVKTDYLAATAALAATPDSWARLITEVPLHEGPAALHKAASADHMKVVLIP